MCRLISSLLYKLEFVPLLYKLEFVPLIILLALSAVQFTGTPALAQIDYNIIIILILVVVTQMFVVAVVMVVMCLLFEDVFAVIYCIVDDVVLLSDQQLKLFVLILRIELKGFHGTGCLITNFCDQ